MARPPFPGYPAFLDAAAAAIGHPEAAGPARRIAALAAMAGLCAQATEAEPAHVAGILAKASEFRNQLHAAARAADLMLVDVAAGGAPAPAPRGPEKKEPRR